MVHRVWNVDKKELHSSDGGRAGGGGGKGRQQQQELQPHEVQILVRKVRNKAAGMVGNAVLQYDRPTGRYKVCVVVGVGMDQGIPDLLREAGEKLLMSHHIVIFLVTLWALCLLFFSQAWVLALVCL